MTFEEFKAWFATFDSALGGKAPALPQWWELKARLDAVDALLPPRSDRIGQPSGRPAVQPTASLAAPAPQADLDVEDLDRSELTVFEEAVQLLKKPSRHSRAGP